MKKRDESRFYIKLFGLEDSFDTRILLTLRQNYDVVTEASLELGLEKPKDLHAWLQTERKHNSKGLKDK